MTVAAGFYDLAFSDPVPSRNWTFHIGRGKWGLERIGYTDRK